MPSATRSLLSVYKGPTPNFWAVAASKTWPVPAGLDIAKVVALPISFGSAYHSVINRGDVREGETVLIQAAAGGVGLAAVQLAKQAGASASGSERQARLTELGAAFVIAAHLDPTQESHLSELLGRCTTMPVQEIGDELQLAPNQVYVIAPDRELTIRQGVIRSEKPTAPRGRTTRRSPSTSPIV